LVWETGASFGLTPFRGDFLDYVECKITVRDISKENVIGVGTTLHKFKIDGQDILYHVYPIICLQQKSGFSVHRPIICFTEGTALLVVITLRIEKFIDNFRIRIDIDREASNVPMVHDYAQFWQKK
jgi:hypothetical protein